MMFGSVAGWFLFCQTTVMAGEQLSGTAEEGRPQGATGWGLPLRNHWPLSHQHELGFPGFMATDPKAQVSAARG